MAAFYRDPDLPRMTGVRTGYHGSTGRVLLNLGAAAIRVFLAIVKFYEHEARATIAFAQGRNHPASESRREKGWSAWHQSVLKLQYRRESHTST